MNTKNIYSINRHREGLKIAQKLTVRCNGRGTDLFLVPSRGNNIMFAFVFIYQTFPSFFSVRNMLEKSAGKFDS